MKLTLLIPVLLAALFAGSCQKETHPANIPAEARFDKKRNMYTLTKNGLVKSWFADGALYSECEVNAAGQRNGECRFYSNKGVVISKGRFTVEERDGMWVWNFSDGSLYYKQNFAPGKRKEFWVPLLEWGNEHGLYERYYKSGKLEERGFFDSGERHGAWVKYFPDGSKEYSGLYSHGKKVSTWRYYFPAGMPEAEEIYDANGGLVKRVSWFTDGKTRCTEIPAEKLLQCHD